MESDHFLVPPHLYMPTDDQFFLLRKNGAAARGEKKRRFTEEQIRSLESMFHAHQAKLEQREKVELAKELGLQPRQVAIWFQNKRARWRSKQLEKDYAALRAQYDALFASVEALKDEKLVLAAQLQKLRDKLKEQQDRSGKVDGGSSTSSSCNGEEDEKRDFSCVMEPERAHECTAPVAIPVVHQSECDHLAYSSFPEPSFCATPELWEPWPLVEWNAVA